MAINGYLETYLPDHPRAKSNGCVYSHIISAEEMLGRALNPHEVVHHLDENRVNNSPENLMVLFDKADHVLIHNGRPAVKRLDGSYTCVANRYKVSGGWTKTWYIYNKATKIQWPDVEEVVALVKINGFSKAGRVLGVSDNAIRKFLKKHNAL